MACYQLFPTIKLPHGVVLSTRLHRGSARADASFFSAVELFNYRFSLLAFTVPRTSVPFERQAEKKSGTHFAMNNDVAELSLAVIIPNLTSCTKRRYISRLVCPRSLPYTPLTVVCHTVGLNRTCTSRLLVG